MADDPITQAQGATSSTPTTLKKASRWELYFPSSSDEAADCVFVASFPKIIYFWPTMLTFFVCGLMQMFQSEEASVDAQASLSSTLAWWAIGVLSVNLLIIVQDFDQKKFIILLLAVVAVAMGGWIATLKGVPIVSGLGEWLGRLSPAISTHAFFILGGILVLFMFWGLFRPMFDYWRLEPNEFVHYIQPFGRDISVPRMGHTVNKEIPDILEYLLTFGGGSLVIRSGDRVVARIPDIPMLGRRMDRVEKMLGVTRVTHVN